MAGLLDSADTRCRTTAKESAEMGLEDSDGSEQGSLTGRRTFGNHFPCGLHAKL